MFSRRLNTIVFLSAMLAPNAASAKDYHVSASGYAFCRDSLTGQDIPLAGARVQMMDSDADGSTIFDDIMGSSHVNADGSFAVDGKGGDPGSYSWSRPDVYIRVVYNDDTGARETDEIDNDQWFDTPEHKHNNTSDGAHIDFGGWETGLNVPTGAGTKCGVWINAHNAFQAYVNLIGSKPPAGHYDVLYWSAIWAGTPWTNTDTTHWPIHYPLYASLHEFGHSIRHAADGDGAHFAWDATRFRYARNHDECDANANANGADTAAATRAFGFNEGWAEYWNGDDWGCANTSRADVEGNIAAALTVISQQPGMSQKRMVDVLKAHPGAIHSLDEFVKFVPQPLSLNLSQIVATMKKGPMPVKARNWFEPEDQAVQAALVRTELARLSPTPKTIGQLAQTPVHPQTLGKDACAGDCEVAFRNAISPAAQRATAALNALAVRRLRASLDGGQARGALQASSGSLDGDLAKLRASERTQTIAIVQRAYDEAVTAVAALAQRSPEVAALAADLRDKASRYRALALSKHALPLGSTERVTLPEDDPVSQASR